MITPLRRYCDIVRILQACAAGQCMNCKYYVETTNLGVFLTEEQLRIIKIWYRMLPWGKIYGRGDGRVHFNTIWKTQMGCPRSMIVLSAMKTFISPQIHVFEYYFAFFVSFCLLLALFILNSAQNWFIFQWLEIIWNLKNFFSFHNKISKSFFNFYVYRWNGHSL